MQIFGSHCWKRNSSRNIVATKDTKLSRKSRYSAENNWIRIADLDCITNYQRIAEKNAWVDINFKRKSPTANTWFLGLTVVRSWGRQRPAKRQSNDRVNLGRHRWTPHEKGPKTISHVLLPNGVPIRAASKRINQQQPRASQLPSFRTEQQQQHCPAHQGANWRLLMCLFVDKYIIVSNISRCSIRGWSPHPYKLNLT